MKNKFNIFSLIAIAGLVILNIVTTSLNPSKNMSLSTIFTLNKAYCNDSESTGSGNKSNKGNWTVLSANSSVYKYKLTANGSWKWSLTKVDGAFDGEWVTSSINISKFCDKCDANTGADCDTMAPCVLTDADAAALNSMG